MTGLIADKGKFLLEEIDRNTDDLFILGNRICQRITFWILVACLNIEEIPVLIDDSQSSTSSLPVLKAPHSPFFYAPEDYLIDAFVLLNLDRSHFVGTSLVAFVLKQR